MYFENCKELNELKAEYRKLAFKNHPDRGGKVEVMAAINNAYDEALKRIARSEGKATPSGEQSEVNFNDLDDGFREVLEKLMNLDGLDIELCGAWLWIGGNTREHKETLKAAGCKWASKKKMWYWRPESARIRRATGIKDMSYIRTVYGSEKIKKEENKKRRIAS